MGTPKVHLCRPRYGTSTDIDTPFERLPDRALQRSIEFCHPGYCNTLGWGGVFLMLPVVDVDHEDRLGVIHALAYEACKVIANNRAGFLSVSLQRDAPTGVPGPVRPGRPDPLTVLTEDAYYYHLLEETQAPYPICTSFEAWTPLSENDVPEDWRRPGVQPDVFVDGASTWDKKSAVVRFADLECCITHHHVPLKTTHLVPRAERQWVAHHGHTLLNRYPLGWAIHTSLNLLTMKIDMGAMFDRPDGPFFVIIPWYGQFRVHWTLNHTHFAYPTHNYHGWPVSLPDRIGAQFLYARFAWAILRLIPWGAKHSLDAVAPLFMRTLNSPSTESSEKSDTPPKAEPWDDFLKRAFKEDAEAAGITFTDEELDSLSMDEIHDRWNDGQSGFSRFFRLKLDWLSTGRVNENALMTDAEDGLEGSQEIASLSQ